MRGAVRAARDLAARNGSPTTHRLPQSLRAPNCSLFCNGNAADGRPRQALAPAGNTLASERRLCTGKNKVWAPAGCVMLLR